MRPGAVRLAALVTAVLATVHLLGALGENAAGHHAHVGVIEDGHHGSPSATAHAPDTPAFDDAPHAHEGDPDSGDEGDPHAPEDSEGSCGYSAATGTTGGAVDAGGGRDPSTLLLERARLGCLEQPGRPSAVRTPHLVKDLQVIRV